mmetsp:Transcript_85497/g.142363  ORF Transcript_85497/g.142363 Transcript_85497/m.142363 type:complete len:81 (+) Transcript_85497:1639-1881(+)
MLNCPQQCIYLLPPAWMDCTPGFVPGFGDTRMCSFADQHSGKHRLCTTTTRWRTFSALAVPMQGKQLHFLQPHVCFFMAK